MRIRGRFDFLGANFSRPTGSLRQRPKNQKVYTMCPVESGYYVSVAAHTRANTVNKLGILAR